MTRVNERIRAPKVRVVYGEGQQLGIMSTREAIEKAKSVGLDLVEIAPNVNPPVARVVDYGKWKYEQSKLKKSSKSKTTTKMKEVKFRVRTEEHDYNIKCSRAEQFLEEGHKVRIQLQFRGRENAHREIGFDVMQRVKKDLLSMANVDMEPKLVGRAIGMILSPLPAAKRVRKFNMEHGELIEEDDFDDDEDEDGEDVDVDIDHTIKSDENDDGDEEEE